MSPLSFQSARGGVLQALYDVIREQDERKLAQKDINNVHNRHLIAYIVLAPLFCSVFLTISLVQSVDISLVPGLATTIFVLLFIGVGINLGILWATKHTAAEEVNEEVKALVAAYEDYFKSEITEMQGHESEEKIFTNISDNNEIKIDTSTLASAFANAPAGGDPPGQGGNEDTKSASIISGHSHISIVTTYRQGIWQRIPTLLLAEGDVIALMGGDVTPGDVYELYPHRLYTNTELGMNNSPRRQADAGTSIGSSLSSNTIRESFTPRVGVMSSATLSAEGSSPRPGSSNGVQEDSAAADLVRQGSFSRHSGSSDNGNGPFSISDSESHFTSVGSFKHAKGARMG